MAGLIDDYGGRLPTEPRLARAAGRRLRRARAHDRRPAALGATRRARSGASCSTHFDGRVPTPREILDEDPETLRAAAGFSRAKVVYLRSLAEHVLDGELELDRLAELPDDEVIRELTAVKGIGEWSAHMFLMFTLHRPDVLPVGDLGVRNAAMKAYGLRGAAHARGARGARRGVAPAPHARQLVPLAQPREHT